MLDKIKYFFDCVRLVAWANSNKPFIKPSIEIELHCLNGDDLYFEVTETPETIEHDGNIFVRLTNNHRLYKQVAAPIPLEWLQPEFVEANLVAHWRAEADKYKLPEYQSIEDLMNNYHGLMRYSDSLPAIITDETIEGDRVKLEPINHAPNIKAANIKPNSLEAVNGYLRAIDRPQIDDLDQFYGEVHVVGIEDLGEVIESFNADMDDFLKTLNEIQKKPISGEILASGSIRKPAIVNLSEYKLSDDKLAALRFKSSGKIPDHLLPDNH